MTRFVLGGYGPALGVADLGPEGFGPPVEVAAAASPSFVVVSADGRFVYAALEGDDGRVAAWAVSDDLPWPALGQEPTGGAAPCHVALSPDGRSLATANYQSGSVCLHPVLDDGSLGVRTDLVEHHGTPGPRADRQDGPHAHQAVFIDDGLLVCDLGLDEVIGYHLEDGRLTEVDRSAMPAGSGPRHLALDGATAYVLGELSSTVTVCDVTGLELRPRESVPLRADGATGENTAAEVVVVGEQILASNRGDDTVAVFTKNGRSLRRNEIVTAGGSWPRWVGVMDGSVLVANERSDRVACQRRTSDGWAVVDVLDWPAPTCCAPVPG